MRTPILILAHRRADHLKRCIEKLISSGAKNIYTSVDGPVSENDQQHGHVQKLILALGDRLTDHQFLPKNLGCKAGVEAGVDWFFSKVDAGIIVEEDVLISTSGLEYLMNGLTSLSNHSDVFMLGAHLPTGKWGNADPFRSTLGTIWGWATWKDRWQKHRSEFDRLSETQKVLLIRNTFSDTTISRSLTSAVKLIENGELDTWDFQWNISLLNNKGCCVLPPSNQVENIGISEDALHTKGLHSGVCNEISEPRQTIDWDLIQPIDLAFEAEWFRRLKGQKCELKNAPDQDLLQASVRQVRHNLVLVNTTDNGGGAEKIFGQTLSRNPNSTGLVAVKKTDDPKVVEIGKTSSFNLPFTSPKTLEQAIDRSESEPDLIHIHNLHGTGISLKEILKLAESKPVIWTLHDQWLLGKNENHPFTSEGKIPRINQQIFNHPNIHFTAPSIWLQDLVLRKTGRLPYLIRHGIDRSIFKPMDREASSSELGLDQKRTRLLFIANNPETNPYKDFTTLRTAWEKVCSSSSENVDLICLGAREPKTEDSDFGQIQFVPFADEQTVAKYLNACDCLVHATESDVSSLSILEAFACKTPVIASAVGGIPELILGERHSRLVSPRNADALASAVSQSLGDRQGSQLMVESAFEYVTRVHDPETAHSSYLGLYAKVCS